MRQQRDLPRKDGAKRIDHGAKGWILLVTSVALGGCGGHACAGKDQVERLILQLNGKCCQYSTAPTDQKPDSSCKVEFWRPWRHPDEECVRFAADCLGQLGTDAQRATPHLIEAAKAWPNNFDTGDGVIPVRDSILEALGRTGDSRAVDPLVQALNDVRPLGALRGLELFGPPAARSVPGILSILSRARAKKDASAVEAAARALASIGDPAGLPALEQLMREDPERNDRYRIGEAIDRIRKEKGAPR